MKGKSSELTESLWMKNTSVHKTSPDMIHKLITFQIYTKEIWFNQKKVLAVWEDQSHWLTDRVLCFFGFCGCSRFSVWWNFRRTVFLSAIVLIAITVGDLIAHLSTNLGSHLTSEFAMGCAARACSMVQWRSIVNVSTREGLGKIISGERHRQDQSFNDHYHNPKRTFVKREVKDPFWE